MAGQFACTRSPSACCRNTAAAGSVTETSSVAAPSCRPRRAADQTPVTHSTATKGVASANWPPTSSARWRGASIGCQSPVRPPCLMKLAKPCPAFHHSTGAKQSTATAPPAQGQGVRNHRRARGSARSHNERPAPSKLAVYLLSSAPPAASPTASHQAGRPVATKRPSAASAAVQNSSSGVSGVRVTAPAPPTRVAFNSAAAGTPARRPGNRSSAARTSSSVPSAAAKGPSRRMPNAPCPANAVPARIQSATMGGWSR